MAKSGSFGFAEALALCIGAKPKEPFVRLAKIVFKKVCGMGKIKNTEWSALSVGSVALQLQYGLYVGHLSKWFVFVNSFMFLVVCLLMHGRLLGLLITEKAWRSGGEIQSTNVQV